MFGVGGLARAWRTFYPDVRTRLRCWEHGRWEPCEPCIVRVVRDTGLLVEGWHSRAGRVRP